MLIGSLVVTLAEDDEAVSRLLGELADDERFTIGPRRGDRLALVCETGGRRAAEDAYYALMDRPGVADVALAASYYDHDDRPSSDATAP